MNANLTKLVEEAKQENFRQKIDIINDTFRAAKFAHGLGIQGYSMALAEPGQYFDMLHDLLLDDLILHEATLNAAISQHFKNQAGLNNTTLLKP